MREILVVFILLNTMALFVFGVIGLLINFYSDEKFNFKIFLIYILSVNVCFIFALGLSYFALWLDNTLK